MAAFVSAAQIIGVTSMIASISFIGIPAIALAPPEIAARQWQKAYNIGKASAPPFAITSAACFAYLAYAFRHAISKPNAMGLKSPMVLYAVAAVAIPCIVPFTILVMNPRANLRLIALAGEAEQAGKGKTVGTSEGEVRQLLRTWTAMNYVRAVVVGAGAVLGAVATMGM
ncbi:hypothetical protein B0A55_04681 [Friedmanniomyces simplex]|uniref:DUF1772 domain-containing protein n=1 Tax=Friedmanniomyces simplex TaxID=329884 RepID=A0A4U0XKQ7_9PEZI|nr:hypothetical protein B0A55_04681 [Friedmanniomyces simplex]